MKDGRVINLESSSSNNNNNNDKNNMTNNTEIILIISFICSFNKVQSILLVVSRNI
jgi:hypothetical protein